MSAAQGVTVAREDAVSPDELVILLSAEMGRRPPLACAWHVLVDDALYVSTALGVYRDAADKARLWVERDGLVDALWAVRLASASWHRATDAVAALLHERYPDLWQGKPGSK